MSFRTRDLTELRTEWIQRAAKLRCAIPVSGSVSGILGNLNERPFGSSSDRRLRLVGSCSSNGECDLPEKIKGGKFKSLGCHIGFSDSAGIVTVNPSRKIDCINFVNLDLD